jgi:hypothetical protein
MVASRGTAILKLALPPPFEISNPDIEFRIRTNYYLRLAPLTVTPASGTHPIYW